MADDAKHFARKCGKCQQWHQTADQQESPTCDDCLAKLFPPKLAATATAPAPSSDTVKVKA